MEKLIDLFKAKTVYKEFKTPALSFKLRTLTTDELADVLRRADFAAVSPEAKLFVAKKVTLAYSLESINNVEILAIPEVVALRDKYQAKNENKTKVDLLSEIIGEFDAEVVDDLYKCYNIAVEESNKSREQLKKVLVAQ